MGSVFFSHHLGVTNFRQCTIPTEAGSTQLDSGIARVDAKIKQHNDLRAEIDSFQPQYQKLLDTGSYISHISWAEFRKTRALNQIPLL